ncbi:hypothetical protein QYE76_054462 [Lolium multiflorum]|uniref:CCHC-type domain-containing protein n=1 Tax=Lolium multiflorum TaxID=4521 RepID=A0AAD8SZF2_LOLMU|nr:hypothetical protein QYE76_054462 [Lolium multiflorum]
MVNKTTSFKKQGKPKKGNFKKGGKKAAAPPEKPKGGPKPDTECYYCNRKGYWKRNCPKYLADLKSGLVKKKKVWYVFILNGAAVRWASSKKCTVAKSSTESEYIAASEASSEAVWMKRFIVELGVVPSALDPLVIYCDNMGAIANAQEPRSHKKLKHIKLRFHSIREYIKDGEESRAGGLMGHFGREKTLLMLADHFYWPKMRRDVDRYEEETSIARGGEKQLDVKMDVELDMELDMKISHGRAREEREACARGEDKVQAGPARTAPAARPVPAR